MNKMQRFNIVKILIIITFISLLFFIWFSNFFHTQYFYPPGTDPAVHIEYISGITQGEYSTYPPLLHIISLVLNNITGLSLNYVLIFLPLFILGVVSPLIIFLLLKKILNFSKAILAIPWLIGLPLLVIEVNIHGQLPETLSIFLILFTIYILSFRKYYLAAFLLLPIFSTHHLSAIPFFICFSVIIFLQNLKYFKQNKKAFIIWLIIFLAIFIIAISVWGYYGEVFKNYSEYLVNWLTGQEASRATDTVPWQNIFSAWRINGLFVICFLLGLFLIAYNFFQTKKILFEKFIFVFGWLIVLFLLSRIPWDNEFSSRLWRLAIFPALIICSLGFIFLTQYFRKYSKIIIISFLIIISVVNITTAFNFIISPYDYEVIKKQDREAVKYIQDNIPSDKNLLTNLAYGRWLRALIPNQVYVTSDRTITIQGRDKDFWQVLQADPESQEIVKKYQVDYIYVSGPIAGVPYEYTSINAETLMETGLWKEVFKNDRVRILQYQDL